MSPWTRHNAKAPTPVQRREGESNDGCHSYMHLEFTMNNGPLPMHNRHRKLRGALRTLQVSGSHKPDVITDDGGEHWTITDLPRAQALALAIACQTSSDARLWPLGMVLGELLFPPVDTSERAS